MWKLEADQERLFKEEKRVHHHQDKSDWVIMENCCEDVTSDDTSSTRSMEESSINSVASISFSSDLVEDASSSSSTSLKSLSSSSTLISPSSSSSIMSFSAPSHDEIDNGPLYELSDLMVHLPLRRGLSKFYQGKSQSFKSLASVKSSEDLQKKVGVYGKKIMKPCKNYSPKPVIAKRSQRASSYLSSHLPTFRSSVYLQKT